MVLYIYCYTVILLKIKFNLCSSTTWYSKLNPSAVICTFSPLFHLLLSVLSHNSFISFICAFIPLSSHLSVLYHPSLISFICTLSSLSHLIYLYFHPSPLRFSPFTIHIILPFFSRSSPFHSFQSSLHFPLPSTSLFPSQCTLHSFLDPSSPISSSIFPHLFMYLPPSLYPYSRISLSIFPHLFFLLLSSRLF